MPLSSSTPKGLLQSLANASYQYYSNPNAKPESPITKTIQKLLKQVDSQHLGLQIEMQKSIDSIYYYDVLEHSLFSICIFMMPKGSQIPLHDHPHMTVFTKVLFGSIKLSSFDLMPPTHSSDTKNKKIKKEKEDILKQNDISIVWPTVGNLHQIEALETCAFIDVIGPPYNQKDRKCTYYRILSDNLVEEYDPGFYCENQIYIGELVNPKLLKK